MWNKIIQNKAGKKSADDGFNSCCFCKKRCEKDNRQNKNILRNTVFIVFEKPADNYWKNEENDSYKNNGRNAKRKPKGRCYFSFGHASNHCKNQQCKNIGDHRTANR